MTDVAKILLYIIAIFIMGFIGLWIGAGKGRKMGGFWLGFLLGPIGWIITACLGDVRFKCSMCGGAVPEHATTCRHCRADLSQSPMGEGSSQPCPFCHYQILISYLQRGLRYCPRCKKEFTVG